MSKLYAVGAVVAAWFLYEMFVAPSPLGSGEYSDDDDHDPSET